MTAREESTLDRGGVALGIGAYVMWGLFPGFWALLSPASPPEVLAHRILWTSVLMAVVLTALRGWRQLRGIGRRGWAMVSAAAVFIAINWGVFIYAVSIGHVVEGALGYYMTPLVSVLLAVLVLHERLSRAQWTALGTAAAAVLVIGIGNGDVPWLSLVLAVSFGTYGLIKNRIPLSSAASLTGEGLVLAPIALAYVVVLALTGGATFTALGTGHLLLMLAAGPATALPLFLYGAAARRIPMSTLGVLLYINPTVQFLWGVLVVGEQMSTTRWIGFGLVWIALTIFTVDLVRRARRVEPAQPVRSTV